MSSPNLFRSKLLSSCQILLVTLSLTFVSVCWAQSNMNTHYSVLVYHNLIDESDPALLPLTVPKAAGTVALTLPKTLSNPPTPAVQTSLQDVPQSITIPTLVKHFNWLKANGYTPVSFQQVIDAKSGKTPLPPKAVLLSFDDGYESFYRLVFPLLKLYNFPAIQALVTSWIETPENGLIAYGDVMIPRSNFLTWPQIIEMQNSGLVEFASHSNAMHKGVVSNPFKTQQPALISPAYSNGTYETEDEYRNRISNDFETSMQIFKTQTGIAPRIMVWPYGQFNDIDVALAQQAGFTYFFTLGDLKLNTPDDNDVGRYLLDEESSLYLIDEYLTQSDWNKKPQRVVHVDMDYLYDTDIDQQNKNLDALIERICQYGVTTVYLQAYSDPDGDGVADALYFPNRYLPMRADLFNRVAWQLMTRCDVKVYAWMPILAFNLGDGYDYVTDARTHKPAANEYLRLSPYSQKNRQIIQEIYEDLGFHAKFDGVLFHDDGFLTDFEGFIASEPRSEAELIKEAMQKNNDLIEFTQTLKSKAGQFQSGGVKQFKTARNLYASVITDNDALKWFAQNLQSFSKFYDYTAIMAMPYMEHEQNISAAQANNWLAQLAASVKKQVNPELTVFELQAVNWRRKTPIPDAELINWMNTLKQQRIENFGYYPDNFIENQPNAKILHPVFSVNMDGRLP